jgi:hypothetical protein
MIMRFGKNGLESAMSAAQIVSQVSLQALYSLEESSPCGLR